jgi:hypothetical protein
MPEAWFRVVSSRRLPGALTAAVVCGSTQPWQRQWQQHRGCQEQQLLLRWLQLLQCSCVFACCSACLYQQE